MVGGFEVEAKSIRPLCFFKEVNRIAVTVSWRQTYSEAPLERLREYALMSSAAFLTLDVLRRLSILVRRHGREGI